MLVQKAPRHFRGCGILPRLCAWRAKECLTQSPPSPPRECEESGREEPTRRRGGAGGLEGEDVARKRGRTRMLIRQGFSLEGGACGAKHGGTETRRDLGWSVCWKSLRTRKTPDKRLGGRFWKCEAPPWKFSVSPFSARSVFCAAGRGERRAGGLVPWVGGAYLIRIRGRSFFIARLLPNPHCSGCARCRGWSGRCAFRRGGGRGGRRARGKRDGWCCSRDGG